MTRKRIGAGCQIQEISFWPICLPPPRSARRQSGARDDLEKVAHVFKHLAQEKLPPNYTLSRQKSPVQCEFSGVEFDFARGRTITGQGITVYVGTAENVG